MSERLHDVDALRGLALLGTEAVHTHATQVTDRYRESAASALKQRMHDWPLTMIILAVVQGPSALAMFLLGLLRKHTYGPVEWLLRALTRWSWRRDMPSATAEPA